MSEQQRRDWTGPARFRMTWACERGLAAAAGILWQRLAALAAGQMEEIGEDYFSPSRRVIAEYLRHTGRHEEAMEVEAIGCNEPAPVTGFGGLTVAQRAHLRNILGG